MLALPSPAMYGRGRHFRVVWNGYNLRRSYEEQEFPTWEEAHLIAGVMALCQCPPWAMRRIAQCLYYSGEFTCSVVTPIRELNSIRQPLAELGCTFTAQHVP